MANPKRYIVTSDSAPVNGLVGAPLLANDFGANNIDVKNTGLPVAGQVLTAVNATQADWATPVSGGVVDDPTVRTSNFTAVANTRYFIDSSFTVQVSMPLGPAYGDIVVVSGIGFGSNTTNILGNGYNFQLADTVGSAFAFATHSLDLAFRFSPLAGGRWESITTSVSSLLSLSSPLANALVGGNGSGKASAFQLANGDSVLGRVLSGNLQELRPWHQAHNLFDDAQNIVDSQTGSTTSWTPGFGTTNFYRSSHVRWEGGADLIVRGMTNGSPFGSDFRADKWILNNTDVNGTGGYRNIIWLNGDTSAATFAQVRHSATNANSGLTAGRYVQAPGEIVLTRFHFSMSRWYLIALGPSGGGRIDRGVTTTTAAVTTIHTNTTSNNSRVITYRVQVQALLTAGTTVGDAALFDITALFFRDSGGTVSQKDVTFVNGPYKDAGAAAWDVTFSISGSDINLRVTGEASDTIRWRATGYITEHG